MLPRLTFPIPTSFSPMCLNWMHSFPLTPVHWHLYSFLRLHIPCLFYTGLLNSQYMSFHFWPSSNHLPIQTPPHLYPSIICLPLSHHSFSFFLPLPSTTISLMEDRNPKGWMGKDRLAMIDWRRGRPAPMTYELIKPHLSMFSRNAAWPKVTPALCVFCYSLPTPPCPR